MRAFRLDCPSQMFISIGTLDTKVRHHSHDEGDGIRFIASGSTIYQTKELAAGEGMVHFKGLPESFTVALGAQ
jgi:hypothetical protein